MTPPTISCSVIDRRDGQPAVGLTVALRCLNPRTDYSDFCAVTNDEGYIFNWPGLTVPAITLLNFLFANANVETTHWQMGFQTFTYFEPIRPSYCVADVNFTLSRGQPFPHVTLVADTQGFEAKISVTNIFPISIQNTDSQPHCATQRKRAKYHKFSQDQNKALMEHYTDEPYPSSIVYFQLSEQLNLSRKQTIRWFRRRRAQGRFMKNTERADVEEQDGTTGVLEALTSDVDKVTIKAEAHQNLTMTAVKSDLGAIKEEAEDEGEDEDEVQIIIDGHLF